MELQLRDFMKLIRDIELVSMLETITDYRVKLSLSFLVCSSFHPSAPLSLYPFKFLTVERKRERIHVNAVVKIYMSQRPTLSFISLAPSIIFIETVVSVVWNLPHS